MQIIIEGFLSILFLRENLLIMIVEQLINITIAEEGN